MLSIDEGVCFEQRMTTLLRIGGVWGETISVNDSEDRYGFANRICFVENRQEGFALTLCFSALLGNACEPDFGLNHEGTTRRTGRAIYYMLYIYYPIRGDLSSLSPLEQT